MIPLRRSHKITAAVLAACALVTTAVIGIYTLSDKPPVASSVDYDTRLFDDSRVHTIDLQIQDAATFFDDAANEEYVPCTAVIDGETFETIGLRTKGNSSLRLTEDYGLCRYSLKLEFDRYQSDLTYYGLDKLSLDASFQDNSYMKTVLVMDMMRFMGVPAPLCSYVSVSINSEPWGLFVAVEEPEDGFAARCFSEDHGPLYKPDYQSLSDENADVALRYISDDPADYPNIFGEAKFPITRDDMARLIGALKTLDSGENLDTAIDVDEVLRYFAVQVFVLNFDSYIGPTGHNYFLYEEDGRLSMIPWDYNLAFGTYCLGMTDPIRDPQVLINYPVHTPWEGGVMLKRPLFHKLMQHDAYFQQYRRLLDELVAHYVESGYLQSTVSRLAALIAPHVQSDPTAFCSYDEHLAAVQMLTDVCLLRAQSIRGQLDGRYPATLKARDADPTAGVDAAAISLEVLGDFADLENAKARQDEALSRITS